ncbi:1,4-alpha-glucan branching protein [Streptomyces sp. A1136]|uniref:maltokinase N-terminal cap-like domain-containing protein n=1 Tax=Streptomyces sp. A1136 TaxID=2563102 RepID=UPI00109EA605|nr:1,4-alpha-glucan branching protein [Streptomyces sp. A1136]THA56907.1 1,4-alpha-glucan branching protein [Streptomyces sp. A1136]
MAIIHKTSMTPGKLELLASWLPTQPWYASAGRAAEPVRAGGFRLDDPEGEVGMEFMVLTDDSGGRPVAYHVPLTYRGSPLEDAEAALIGTSEHGVLGRRWVYDGTRDPVLVGQLLSLLQGRTVAQAQTESDTPDPSVTTEFDGRSLLVPLLPPLRPEVAHTARDSEIALGDGSRLTVARVLRPHEATGVPSGAIGGVTAGWTAPDGTTSRALFAALYAG